MILIITNYVLTRICDFLLSYSLISRSYKEKGSITRKILNVGQMGYSLIPEHE